MGKDARKYLSSFDFHCIEALRIEPQCFQDGRRDLRGLHRSRQCFGRKLRAGDQNHDVSIAMREASVFRLLLVACAGFLFYSIYKTN